MPTADRQEKEDKLLAVKQHRCRYSAVKEVTPGGVFDIAPIAVRVIGAGGKRMPDVADHSVGDRQPVMQAVPPIGVVRRNLGANVEVDERYFMAPCDGGDTRITFLTPRRLGRAGGRLAGDMGRHGDEHHAAPEAGRNLVEPGERRIAPRRSLRFACDISRVFRLFRLRLVRAPELEPDLHRVVVAFRRGKHFVTVHEARFAQPECVSQPPPADLHRLAVQHIAQIVAPIGVIHPFGKATKGGAFIVGVASAPNVVQPDYKRSALFHLPDKKIGDTILLIGQSRIHGEIGEPPAEHALERLRVQQARIEAPMTIEL